MQNANPAPVGVIAFGTAAFVVGSLFAGLFGPMNAGNMLAAGVMCVIAGILLFATCCMMITKNSLADSAVFSMWGGTIFGFFSFVWSTLGIILILWKTGVEQPLGYLLLFACVFSIGYMIQSYMLKLWSFAILFLAVALGTLSGFGGLVLGWNSNMYTGWLIIIWSLLALYIMFKEQLSAVLPSKE
jgi:succinate-acetate transporter protein